MMGTIILGILLGAIATTAFVVGGLQLAEKGPLLNNSYFYASEKERAKMNKSPYYRQSGIVLLLVGVIFLLNCIAVFGQIRWMIWFVLLTAGVTLLYAVISSIHIDKTK